MDLAQLFGGAPQVPGKVPQLPGSTFDPKGLTGQMARGSNVYLGGLPNAPGAGRPRNAQPVMAQQIDPALMAAINKRLMGYGNKGK
jgi:hypothetical protein